MTFDERDIVVTIKVPMDQINHDGIHQHIYGEVLGILKETQVRYGGAVEITMRSPRAH